MSNQFLYVDTEKRNIENKEFLVIYVLEFYKKRVFKIYKLYNSNLSAKLATLEKFDNINDYISFAIKGDGRISLDINF